MKLKFKLEIFIFWGVELFSYGVGMYEVSTCSTCTARFQLRLTRGQRKVEHQREPRPITA